MKKILLITLITSFLGGCLSDDEDRYVWSRKGRTTKQAEHQMKVCDKRIAGQQMAKEKRRPMFNKCMGASGYRFGSPQR